MTKVTATRQYRDQLLREAAQDALALASKAKQALVIDASLEPEGLGVAELIETARQEIAEAREWLARRYHDSASEAVERAKVGVWVRVLHMLGEQETTETQD